MEYSPVMSYIWWSHLTVIIPFILIGAVCVRSGCMRSLENLIWIIVVLFAEAVQFWNYVLIFTLVGPANGFMAANTTSSFRVFASISGLVIVACLALVTVAAVKYWRSRGSQDFAKFIAQPTSEHIAKLDQPSPSLIRVEYEKAVRKDSERVKMPTSIKMVKIYRSTKTDLRDEFAHVLQHLWKEHAHLIGKGKDAKGLAHSSMDIQSIRNVNNQYVLMRYCCRRQAICEFTASVGGNLRNLPRNSTLSKGQWSNNVDKRINEYYLFHGTDCLNAESIARNGFDVNKCKDGSMLGRGIYFTDSLVKADQYTQPDDSGMCCVIMTRVLLGDFVVAKNRSGIPSTSIQPPCKECMSTLCEKKPDNPHPRFDSVVYTGGLYKEFVVYDNWQAYPEFIIFYKRL